MIGTRVKPKSPTINRAERLGRHLVAGYALVPFGDRGTRDYALRIPNAHGTWGGGGVGYNPWATPGRFGDQITVAGKFAGGATRMDCGTWDLGSSVQRVTFAVLVNYTSNVTAYTDQWSYALSKTVSVAAAANPGTGLDWGIGIRPYSYIYDDDEADPISTFTPQAVFALQTGGGTTSIDFQTVGIGKWYLYHGTYDGSYMRAYENGTLITTQAKTGSLVTGSRDVMIGAAHKTSASDYRSMLGYVAGAWVWNETLSLEEIRRHCNRPWIMFRPRPRRPVITISEDLATLSAGWAVLSEDSTAVSAGWAVVTEESTAVGAGWSVVSEDSTTKDAAWSVLTEESTAVSAGWAVLTQDSAAVSAGWAVVSEDSAALSAGWSVVTEDSSTLGAAWSVLIEDSAAVGAGWAIIAEDSAVVASGWSALLEGSSVKDAGWAVILEASTAVSSGWAVVLEDSTAVSAGWSVFSEQSTVVPAAWSVVTEESAAKAAGWAVGALDSAVVQAAWSVISEQAEAKDAGWSVVQEHSSVADAAWAVILEETSPVAAGWSVLSSDSVVLSAGWAALLEESAVKPAGWAVQGEDSTTLDAAWAVLVEGSETLSAGWSVTMATIQELILQDLKASLEAITTGNGFSRTVKTVSRRPGVPQQHDVPAIFIGSPSETEAFTPNPTETMAMTISMLCMIYSDWDDPEQDVTAFLGDIKEKLLEDNTRGGYAIDTRITGTDQFLSEAGDPLLGVVVNLEILYRHAYGAPSTAI